ncbi:cytochrome c-type biogenesis protein CcmH [Roseivivax lentus]|uniref:Cytochrome c-type biogenesis protein CcmH n=1 Tax=Roseivivax lentus TaxID=633194 RepID=A0A1N7NSH9_9RHOB|nr:c-type cytochrome biogenesis protein CcmI [Roseivivax lentus]SIT01251.1 cytochrome c-type biogenesis protein CcmH [Roseivivax lentus]
MIAFWIASVAMTLLVAALIALALIRRQRAGRADTASDIGVYRDQLREVDRDLERGVIGPEEAERLRTEVSRRILAADAAAQHKPDGASQPRGLSLAVAVLVGAFLMGMSLYLYGTLGAPGYGDLGLADRIAQAEEARANRPDQASAEAQVPATEPTEPPAPEYLALVERLRGAVAERQDDLQGFQLLARSEAALGNYKAAYQAQQRIIALKGDDATAKDYVDLADMMILAAGGYVSPEAERALQAGLARDPENGVATYYAGLSFAQTGRPDRAFRIWDGLLRRSSADDPWVAPIASQIDEMAWRAGMQDYTPPLPDPAVPAAPLPGPSAEDMDAAGEMSAEARQEMIAGMVARLSDRLSRQGGTPEEWARLITAYGVLGDADQARAIWNNAQEVFLGNSEALEVVREGARSAGVAE